MSTITVVGTLGAEPQLRYTNGGRAVCSFSIAENRTWTDHAGEKQETTTWLDVSCWASLAENAAASLVKGSRVIVTGRVEQREWEKDGQKRTAWQIVADAIGPDLRFAQVQVEKVQRQRNPTTIPATPAYEGHRPSDPIFGDEEPF